MKILLDFLPLILFFGTFKYADHHTDWAARFDRILLYLFGL